MESTSSSSSRLSIVVKAAKTLISRGRLLWSFGVSDGLSRRRKRFQRDGFFDSTKGLDLVPVGRLPGLGCMGVEVGLCGPDMGAGIGKGSGELEERGGVVSLTLASTFMMCKPTGTVRKEKYMIYRIFRIARVGVVAMIGGLMAFSICRSFAVVALISLVAMGWCSVALASEKEVVATVDMPRVVVPVQPRQSPQVYPWKRDIKATIFWVGERPTPNNPTTNEKSSWDTEWKRNFGGYDDPNRRNGLLPKGFIPGQNPFYVALPYNDLIDWRRHKPEASKVIPWFNRAYERPGQSVLKGRWVAIRYNGRTVYAQWEDCGPFQTDDWRYVFGNQPQPSTDGNGGAGIDISPAVRDYLGMTGNARVDWRFVEINEIPDGPWRNWGENNHFVQMRRQQSVRTDQRYADIRDEQNSNLARD